MKIKCAVFDFDGTLFDSMFIWDTVGEIYLSNFGKKPTPYMREDLRTLSLYESAVYLQKEYALPLSAEEIMEGINKTIEHFYLYEVLLKDGVSDFLKILKEKGIKMCIATASERYQVEAALKRCEIDNYFDEIFTCTEIGHGKNGPYIFRKAMEHFDGDRSNTVIFEDALHAVKTAKNDGFIVAAVFDNSEKRQNELYNISDFYIKDFKNTEEFFKLSDI